MAVSAEFDKRVLDLFDQVLDVPEEERIFFLKGSCAADEKVLDAVLRYLEAERQRLPDSIGPFLVTDWLGRGAHGVVYKAIHSQYGKVAIKIIGTERSDSSEAHSMERQLMQEALKMSRVIHPNIVEILEINRTGNQPFIVMECVDGPSLKTVLREYADSQRELDITLVVNVLGQLAMALDHSHKQGVVHRDVTPGNTLLMNLRFPANATVKLTDFGIAKVISSSYAYSYLPAGTPGYMSPQQIRMEPVDGRSDQFSLAVVAYEMLTGRKPFEASDEGLSALADMTRDEPLPSLGMARPTLPPTVDAVFRRALRKVPDDRFFSCLEFVTALEDTLAGKADWSNLGPGVESLNATLVADAPAVSKSSETVRIATGSKDQVTDPSSTQYSRHQDVGRKRPRRLFVVCGIATLSVVAGGFLIRELLVRPHLPPYLENIVKGRAVGKCSAENTAVQRFQHGWLVGHFLPSGTDYFYAIVDKGNNDLRWLRTKSTKDERSPELQCSGVQAQHLLRWGFRRWYCSNDKIAEEVRRLLGEPTTLETAVWAQYQQWSAGLLVVGMPTNEDDFKAGKYALLTNVFLDGAQERLASNQSDGGGRLNIITTYNLADCSVYCNAVWYYAPTGSEQGQKLINPILEHRTGCAHKHYSDDFRNRDVCSLCLE